MVVRPKGARVLARSATAGPSRDCTGADTCWHDPRMDLPVCRELHTHARRLTRSDADAADLVQDVLEAALQAGRTDLPWLIGVLQRQAAMAARTAVRRRARESAHGAAPETNDPDPAADDRGSGPPPSDLALILSRMPEASRRVAVLALHGLNADEIRWLLNLSSAAFRQRLSGIRHALGALLAPLRTQALALAYVRDPARSVDLQFGLVRRALKAALAGRPGLATHDVDGHLLVIRGRAHTFTPRGNE